MKIQIFTILAIVSFFSTVFAADKTTVHVGGLELTVIDSKNAACMSCGCCFYYPLEEKAKGRIILDFEYGRGAKATINGKSTNLAITNLESKKNMYINKFSNNETTIDVKSISLEKGRFGATYKSSIVIDTKGSKGKVTTYGVCGC